MPDFLLAEVSLYSGLSPQSVCPLCGEMVNEMVHIRLKYAHELRLAKGDICCASCFLVLAVWIEGMR